jgi:hypothetical protein
MNALFYATSKCGISKVFNVEQRRDVGGGGEGKRRSASIPDSSPSVEALEGDRAGFKVLGGLELVNEYLIHSAFGHLLESFLIYLPALATKLFQCDSYGSVSMFLWAHQPLKSRNSL